MKNKIIIWAFLLAMLVACSSNEKSDHIDSNSDLSKSFELSEGEVSKYAVSEVDPHEKEIIQAPAPVTVVEKAQDVKKKNGFNPLILFPPANRQIYILFPKPLTYHQLLTTRCI